MDTFLTGPTSLARLIREHDWAATPLGPISVWPQSLRTSVSLILNSNHPMWIGWGPQGTFLYNDAYIDVLSAAKHPWALGRPVAEVWSEIWDVCGPLADKVFRHGEASFVDDVRLFMNRGDFLEETFYSFSYSPIRDEAGKVGGLFCPSSDVTAKVVGARRLRTLSELSAQALLQKSVAGSCAAAMATLAANPDDIPFALLYLSERDGDTAVLSGCVGLEAGGALAPATLDLRRTEGAPWPVAEVIEQSHARTLTLHDLQVQQALPAGPAQQPVRHVLVHPVMISGQRPAGALITGVSPGCRLDDSLCAFFGLIAGQVGTAIQHAGAAEEERRRSEALAELDRAKTLFFSNVSHEFRTPLTLMLGPVEDALADADHPLAPPQRERLQLMRRNALRLQKLVNALLDFARIEAGRVRASFAPTDLAALTADLASTFRSTLHGAGLLLSVDCAEPAEPVFVDRTMWEKIVLNLLSNAFKFTHEGSVTVTLRSEGGFAVLRVADTGVGIAADQLPRLFERFHRIEGTRARTHEGSGIGLALVKDLVALHGGTIDVSSEPGRGSTFTVRLPLGHAHLPAEQVQAVPSAGTGPGRSTEAYVAEAERWLPGAADPPIDGDGAIAAAMAAWPSPTGIRVLVADDNADLRDYLRRLLAPRWHIETVADGQAALQSLRHQRPDILITDVMMPTVDGLGLLKALRADPALCDLPVLMLSARAGEEARIEALGSGADDYLIKPFSARELLARVEALTLRSQLRAADQRHAQRMAEVFAQAPAGIALLRGPEHVFELANPSYAALIGHRQVVGRRLRDALPEAAEQGIVALLDGVYGSGHAHVGRSLRVELDDAQGVRCEHFYDFVYQPMCDPAGRVEGIAVVAFDVTELARARRSAELANRAKDEFLAMLGHELRNPLAPILTALHLMRLHGGDLLERERKVIERQAQHLTRLVDDLLDVSRVTEGKLTLRREPVEVSAVVAKAVETTHPLIEERLHQLVLQVPPAGLSIDADPMRMAQVIANLLTNAAKYTERGGHIELRAHREGHEAVIEVSDSGIGIAAGMLPRIFDTFVQERQALDRSRGGLGLGLAIVKSLVGLHGGSVQAASDGLGKGSRFTLRLPAMAVAPTLPLHGSGLLAQGQERPGRVTAPLDAAGATVLIVDDNADAALALAEGLSLSGFRTRAVFDGRAALEEAPRLRPDIVLLDIGLPGMDGYEVARRLRLLPGLAAVRLLAISGYGQAAHQQRSRHAGFERHIVKPIDMDLLLMLIGAAPAAPWASA